VQILGLDEDVRIEQIRHRITTFRAEPLAR
jgi:hypothetical protein